MPCTLKNPALRHFGTEVTLVVHIPAVLECDDLHAASQTGHSTALY